jgi:hypothetical protein
MNIHTATKIILFILAATVAFHVLIVVKVIPYHIAWGGRLQSDQDMYAFETVSILVNVFLALVLCIKANYLKLNVPNKLINFILWCFLILFLLNTIGNIIAVTAFEKSFALVTLALAYLLWVILKPHKNLQ